MTPGGRRNQEPRSAGAGDRRPAHRASSSRRCGTSKASRTCASCAPCSARRANPGLHSRPSSRSSRRMSSGISRAPGAARSRSRGASLVQEVTPALKGTEWTRLDQHHFRLEHQAAAADALLVDERTDAREALTAHDLAADHPVERAAVGEFVGALGHHPRRVDVLGLLPALLLVLDALADPALQLLDRVAADAKLDEMKGHADSYVVTGLSARIDHLPAAARAVPAPIPEPAIAALRCGRADAVELVPLPPFAPTVAVAGGAAAPARHS